MKHKGRALASLFVMLGGALMAYITNDSCVPSVCIMISIGFVWFDAGLFD